MRMRWVISSEHWCVETDGEFEELHDKRVPKWVWKFWVKINGWGER